MMDLDKQVEMLIDNAPQDGVTPKMVRTIAPVLIAIAKKLRHLRYYILQDLQESWVLTTLSNRANPAQQKRVIYAYPTLQDILATVKDGPDSKLTGIPLPVINILFQLIALEPVDSIVFFETNSITSNGIEVKRTDLQQLIQQKILEESRVSKLPPDIA
jgi:hypothetical protein